jgi:hypothetical protein
LTDYEQRKENFDHFWDAVLKKVPDEIFNMKSGQEENVVKKEKK